MAQSDYSKSVVRLIWTDKTNSSARVVCNTGFLASIVSDDEWIILSSANHLKTIFPNQNLSSISPQNIRVEVVFFDTHVEDTVVAGFDETLDISHISVKFPKKSAYATIKPITISTNTTSPRQKIYTFHNPYQCNPCTANIASNDYAEGFITDDASPPAPVSIYLPMVDVGSIGAPVLDFGSDALVCMLNRIQSGTIPPNRKVERLYGVPWNSISSYCSQHGFALSE